MLRRKILSNILLFESETIFSWKNISERKNKFLWIYVWQLLGHLWFNCWWKLLVAGLNWNPWPSRLELLEKFLANNFALSYVEGNTSGSLNSRGIADLLFLRTLLAIHQKSLEPSFWEVMDSFVLLGYGSLAASRTLLLRLLACLNFTLESKDLSLLYKQKKWFLWIMAAAQTAENQEHEWGLTWYFLWVIYTLIPTWTHSHNSLAAAEASSLKIPTHGTSQMITKTHPISTRIVIRYVMKWGIPLWIWWRVSGNWDNNMIRFSQWRESHCRTNISIRRKKEIQ